MLLTGLSESTVRLIEDEEPLKIDIIERKLLSADAAYIGDSILTLHYESWSQNHGIEMSMLDY